MGLFHYVINNQGGETHMSFASFMDDLARGVSKGIRTIGRSEVIPETTRKVTRFGLDVGKKVGKTGMNLGFKTVGGLAEGANFIKENRGLIEDTAKKIGKSALLEANEFAQAGAGALQKFSDVFLTDAPLDRSIFGKKFNKKGIALMAVGATAMQGGRDVKQYIEDRQGSNDGQIYSPTTRMSTPYTLSEQMAYSQHGRSFADNAGATGDLVFALNNMRHG
jgi:hypothetical protein